MRMRLSAVAPLAERVTGAFVVFEQCPPTEVLAGRRKGEFHAARAELSMGALDVGAVEEQVGVGEAIRNRTTRFIGLSRAEDKQQVLLRWPHLDPSLVAIGIVAYQTQSPCLKSRTPALLAGLSPER